MNNIHNLKTSMEKLKQYIEKEKFKGFDPYDILNSKINFNKFGKWGPILAIQVQKRLPFNIRGIVGTQKGINPKAMGLLLNAYSRLYALYEKEDDKKQMEYLFNWLISNYTKGYSGMSWGYNFHWASPVKYLKAYTPSIIVSGFIAKGIFEYYKVTNDPKAVEVLESICDFIIKDLPITKTDYGICFSYTPTMKDCCYNANMIGAEVLAKVYSINNDFQLLELSKQAVNFTLHHQKEEGMWNYSINLENGKERKQIDFHQGYILESLSEFMVYSKDDDIKYLNALKKGADFYKKEQFYVNGQSLWRLPKKFPIDIHNQSQGIITFSLLKNLNDTYPDFAAQILKWTKNNMGDDKNAFYYRKYKFLTDKTLYMRWSEAWMFLSYVFLLTALEEEK